MVVWIGGRQLKRCRNCGHLFVSKHHAEWYCSNSPCQAAKAQCIRKRNCYVRKVRKPAV